MSDGVRQAGRQGLEDEPGDQGRQGEQGQEGGHRRVEPGGARTVAPPAEFKEAALEIEVFGFPFQFFPDVFRAFLAIRKGRDGAGVEVVPI